MADLAPAPGGGLLDALEGAWQRAKGLTAKDVQSGLDAASLATTAWPVVGDAVGLGADAYRYMTQPEERTPGNFAMTALGALPFVPSASALHAAGAAVPAAIGMLRKGGDASLMPWHQADGEKLLSAIQHGRAELTSPSIGISKDAIPDNFFLRNGDAMLIPKVGAFDPGAYSATLFNRDAYTPRSGDYFVNQAEPLFSEAQSRLMDRGMDSMLSGKFLRGAENPGTKGFLERTKPAAYDEIRSSLGGDLHGIPVQDSPIFRNFADFEKSPRGAGVLYPGANATFPQYRANAVQSFEKAFPGISQMNRDTAMQAVGQLMELRGRATSPEGLQMVLNTPEIMQHSYPELNRMLQLDPDALSKLSVFRGGLARSPSNYAELKVHGQTQISPEHFAGALLGVRDGLTSDVGHAVASRLEYLGLPTRRITMGDAYDPQQAFELADELQRWAGPARKSPL